MTNSLHCPSITVIQSYAAVVQPLQRALGRYDTAFKHSFSTALGNPEFLNALLAMAASDYQARRSRASVTKPSASVLYFRGQALKLLSEKLKAGRDAVNVGTVSTVVVLMGVDVRVTRA